MLSAIFADEDSLNKLTKYGLSSGVVFVVLAAIVYDRMTDAGDPATWLLPLVGLLILLASFVVIVSIWSHMERTRSGQETLVRLAAQANVSTVAQLKQLLELKGVDRIYLPTMAITPTATAVEGAELGDDSVEVGGMVISFALSPVDL